ncbi:DUF4855 domain-containing protein [Neobacillus sp. MM2021_6]|uniref:DUF4855 domain-containing protein n=1 Tax=Bacillaceae TaxID=186817 RepID=UPI00140CFC8D|nr:MULTISPECIES: DUF4855 domain-containing protein [Bacillaceae]MBO0961862.1 DUF4855 domain-containing protein [Neobacillus sp. MM2021_6]NHC18971.1 DUF4855 domain-containing protein [Bacillus sp. MM2020_4]
MSTNQYMSAEELGIQNHLCLLPYGEESENGITNWTAEDLRPYQSYLVNGVAIDSMFGGLIFNPISGRKNHYIYPMYTDFGELAEKEDWKLTLKSLFMDDYNLDAAAGNTVDGKKTDIWVTMPYPVLTQTKFGKVEGEKINFKIEEHRFLAMSWWIEKFLSKWKKSKHLQTKLTFQGFVWPRASIDSRDESLVKKVTAFIRQKGLRSLWLQQYGSTGCVEWKEFGFDAACTHPNFYGKIGPDFKWIANSTVFAQHFQVGMQISYGKGILFKENHLLDYLNYGVYNDYMNKSLLVFQFPNQTMRDIYENHPTEYVYLYSFIKKAYAPIYPTAAFPT